LPVRSSRLQTGGRLLVLDGLQWRNCFSRCPKFEVIQKNGTTLVFFFFDPFDPVAFLFVVRGRAASTEKIGWAEEVSLPLGAEVSMDIERTSISQAPSGSTPLRNCMSVVVSRWKEKEYSDLRLS
jgi:hypothetical protein